MRQLVLGGGWCAQQRGPSDAMVANRDYLRSRPQYIPTDPYPSRGPSGPTSSWHRKGTTHASARKGGVLSYGLGALGVVCVVALCYFLIFGGRGKPNTVIKAKVDDFEIYLHHYESKAEPVLVYFVAGGRWRLPPPRDGASDQGSGLEADSLSLALTPTPTPARPIPQPPRGTRRRAGARTAIW